MRREARVRAMSEAEAAWVAGLLEGEGSFMTQIRPGYHTGRICMMSTDKDILDRLALTVGVGNVCGPVNETRKNRKPIWQWRIQARLDVEALVHHILPWMGDRRKDQIAAMLQAFSYRPPTLQTSPKGHRQLTTDQVREIRRRFIPYRRDGSNAKALANEFGISVSSVTDILKWRSYADIESEPWPRTRA